LWAALALVVGAVARFYLLGSVPYGIEGDESMWTWSVAQYVLAGEHGAAPAAGYFLRNPVSFYLETPFLLLLGPSILAVRVEVALLSVVANAAFYLLARRLAGVPVALVATFLLGVSVVDVSASRLGNVESQVKLWTILAPLLLVWGLDSRRLVLYALCGL